MLSEDGELDCEFTEVPAVTLLFSRAKARYKQALRDAEEQMKNTRMLVYHAESESLFETTQGEFDASPDSIDKALCSDVTGIPEFEERFKRESEKGGQTMARETAARSSMRDAARRRAEEQTHGGGGFSINLPEGVTFFKGDGKTVELDFIPYRISSDRNPDVVAGRLKVGDLVDARTYWMHRDVGAEQKPYICLKTIGQRCPICEAQIAMAKNPKADPDEAKALKSKERVLYNVIDANDKDGKVMVMDVSYHLFTKQLEHEQRERDEYYDYADPDNGYTLRIRYEKKSIGRGEPFYEADRIDFTKRKPLSDADMKAAVDLDACLTILSYDKLEAIFLGVDGEPAGNRGADRREPAGDQGRREAPAAESRREPAAGERGRRDTAAPAADTGRSRGRSADTIHDKSPDAPGERERAAGLEPYRGELDEGGGKDKCPGGGRWGVDEGTLGDACQKCDEDVWKSCRDEKDRRAREDRDRDRGKTAGEDGGRGGRRR